MPDSDAVAEPPSYTNSVFINCPFDSEYQPLMDAVVFCVHDCGFFPRCSMEDSDSGDVRLHRIVRLLKACRFSIHDISKTKPDGKTGLPRFNMPLELGIDLGLRHSENEKWRDKKCVVMDSEKYRFQQFISDIAGQDPEAHGNDPDAAIQLVRDWLRTASGRLTVPSAAAITKRYALFASDLPKLAPDTPRSKMTFVDYASYAGAWLKKTKALEN